MVVGVNGQLVGAGQERHSSPSKTDFAHRGRTRAYFALQVPGQLQNVVALDLVTRQPQSIQGGFHPACLQASTQLHVQNSQTTFEHCLGSINSVHECIILPLQSPGHAIREQRANGSGCSSEHFVCGEFSPHAAALPYSK